MATHSTPPPAQHIAEKNKPFWSFLKFQLINANASKRLKNAIPFLESEIRHYEHLIPNEPWIGTAKEYIAHIKKAAADYEPESGWKLYKEVSRNILRADFDHRKVLCLNRAKAVLNESARKMNPTSWRRKTIVQLLAKPDGKENWSKELEGLDANKPADVKKIAGLLAQLNDSGTSKPLFNEAAKKEDIIYATKLLDGHQDNYFSKLRIFKKRIQILTAGAATGLVLWVIFSPEIGKFQYVKDISPDTIQNQANAFWTALHSKDSTYQALIAKEGENKTSESGQEDSDDDSSLDSTKPVSSKPSGTTTDIKEEEDGTAIEKSMAGVSIGPWNKHSRMVSFWVILAGFVGAVVSGFLRSIDSGTKAAIPNHMFGTTVMWARLVLAMVSALAIYIFLSTGVIFIFQDRISFEMLLSFAFVAGFSERLIRGSVEKLTKEELYSGTKPT